MLQLSWLRDTLMRTSTLKERAAAKLNLLPTAIYDAFPSVLFGRMLVVAVRLGVFEEMQKKPQTAEALGPTLQINLNSAQHILSSLAAAGYLRMKKQTYSLAPQASKWLVKSSDHYIGNFLAYVELLHSHWMDLEETIRSGKPARTYIERFSAEEWKIYTLGMMDLARLSLPSLRDKLRIPKGATRLLDVGGSHGLYSIDLCRRHPDLHSTIADLPQVLPHAVEIIQQHQMDGRINFLPCDVTKAYFPPEAYDTALLFNILHGFTSDVNRTLLQSVAKTVKRGGMIYILEELIEPGRRGVGGVLPIMVGLNLQNEIGGSAYRFDEIRNWCNAAGVMEVQKFRLPLPGVYLLRAEKK